MLNFFDTIIQYIETAWEWFTGIIQYTVVLTKTVIGTVDLPILLSPIVPTVLWVSMSLVIALGVIKIILGRTSV